ncbi:hypothetical protein LZK77_16230 [Rhizobium leguminosarum]|nr:hypothetical protein LZK77_16230 [Rhizobium leguminosarum]
MWVRLEDNEINLILGSIPKGGLAEKLQASADPDARAFIEAVQTGDDLEVDEDTVVSRGEDGAFIMSWTWVSNEMAGIAPTENEDEDQADFKI